MSKFDECGENEVRHFSVVPFDSDVQSAFPVFGLCSDIELLLRYSGAVFVFLIFMIRRFHGKGFVEQRRHISEISVNDSQVERVCGF
jgi:hypothetical protein